MVLNPAGLDYTPVILALDLATSTGWACKTLTGNVLSGVQRFDLRRGESPGYRFLRFEAWLGETMAMTHATLVAYEQPHHRGGHATAVLNGLVAIVQTVCAKAKIEHVSVPTGTLKKHATGKGSASKEEMISAAEGWLGRKVSSDDEADAIHVLKWALDDLRLPI